MNSARENQSDFLQCAQTLRIMCRNLSVVPLCTSPNPLSPNISRHQISHPPGLQTHNQIHITTVTHILSSLALLNKAPPPKTKVTVASYNIAFVQYKSAHNVQMCVCFLTLCMVAASSSAMQAMCRMKMAASKTNMILKDKKNHNSI